MTSEEIRKIRKELGRTQEGLALILGTTATTVGRWERGEASPMPIYLRSLQKLKTIADKFTEKKNDKTTTA